MIDRHKIVLTKAPPAGQTCQEYAGAFAEAVGGYLGNPDSTDECNFCQYRNGQAFYAPLEIDYSNVSRSNYPVWQS